MNMAKKRAKRKRPVGKKKKLRKEEKPRIGEILVKRLRQFVEALESGENLAKKYRCWRVYADGTRKRLRKFP